MHHTNRRLASAARWIAGALVALFPLAGYALGLGKLTVRSALNEPLNAEIEVASVTEKELKGLQVGLAPRSDFDQAGIERMPFLSQIKFTVSKRADGNYFIQLRTDQQIEEPFLQLLLAVEWPGGRLVREYTALIDPPVQVAGRPAGIEAPQATPSAPPAVPPPSPMPEPLPPEATIPETIIKEEPSATQPAGDQPEVAQAAPTEPAPAEPIAQEPQASQPAQVAVPAAASPETDSRPVVEPLAPPTAPRQSVPSVAAGWAMEGGYSVKWGDTAWRIAEQVRTDNSQTIEQVVLALYRANPNAFFGNNVNNLKAGQILKLPESAEVESVPAIAARTQFRAQYDAWQEYKIKLAGASSAIKVVDSEPKPGVQTPAAKEPAAKKEQEKVAKASTDKLGQQDELLKIVRSTLQGEKTTPDKKPAEGEVRKDAGIKEQQALADRVATLDESLASRQMETKELGEKVAQVRAQLKREARLIQIEQKDLATAQARTKPEAAQQPEATKSAAPAPKPEAKPEPAPKAEAPKVETPNVEKPAEAPAKAQKPAPAVAPKKPVAPPPVEEKDFFTELMDSIFSEDLFLPMVLGAVVLLSGGIAFVYFNRRRKSIAEFQESILQSEGIGGTTGEPAVTTDTSGQVVSTGDTSFLSDFSQGGMGNIHTDEVDPIAEAEVYLAYGRDETAEEILKEAIVKNPAREELKLKLLEIYANRSDVRAFETLAEEMYAAFGGRPSKNWTRVEELGRKLNPDNPMFRGGGAGAAATAIQTKAAAPSFSDTTKMKATIPPTSTAVVDTQTDLPASPAASSEVSDFDFDLRHTAPPSTAAADQGFDIDFGDAVAKPATGAPDVPGNTRGSRPTASGMDSMDMGKPGSNVIDFDFGEKEETAVTAAPDTDIAVAQAPATGEVIAAGESGEAPQWDETATKLDLARAYIDMGDSEGARSILQEVMAEGNEQQKKQAKELADQIG